MNMDRSLKTARDFRSHHIDLPPAGEKRRYSAGNQRGFTLPEAVTSLTIAGVLLSLATPGLRDLTLNNRMTAEVNAFVVALHTTRSEAVKRGQTVKLCPSRDGKACAGADSDYTWWHEGALLFVDSNDNNRLDNGEALVRVFGKLGGELTVKTSRFRRSVSYLPNGFSTGTNLTFVFCDARGAASIRYLAVSNTGRPRISRKSDSDLSCP
jgi:type IV fimbrial biogenesis protein FimT